MALVVYAVLRERARAAQPNLAAYKCCRVAVGRYYNLLPLGTGLYRVAHLLW